ncbi:hypothetical protein H8356DRAFT_1351303 [Neocallimastix lanati (nom. inval.)]|nr:hypothetical protein H8356DRAFT_1351303 [Neocallimastix sp. JGI-2020a]
MVIAIGAYSIDELCTVDPNKCGPKSNATGIPITVAIGLDELNNPIQGTIYDIIINTF